MRKSLLWLFLSCIWATTNAQFNKKYQLPNKFVTPVALCHSSWDDLYTASNVGGSPYIEAVALTRYDLNGNIITNKRLNTITTSSAKLIETKNGILYFGASSGGYVIIQFDIDLNPIWKRMITLPPGLVTYGYLTGFDIVRQENAGKEYYYFGFGVNAGDNSYIYDQSFALAKLDESGNVLWNNRYKINNRSDYTDAIIGDVFNSMCSYNTGEDEGGFKIVMAGITILDQISTSTNLLGVLLVNEDGSVYNNFKRITTSSNLTQKNPDIVWDGTNFACTTTEACFEPNTTSCINLLQWDPAFSSVAGRYLYGDCENYSTSLMVANKTNNYYLATTQGMCDSNTGYYANSIGLYMVDRTSLAANDHIRYNINTNKYLYLNVTNNLQDLDISDNNYLAGFKNGNNTSEYHLQLIKADANGTACGSQRIQWAERDFNPGITTYDYSYGGLEDEELFFELSNITMNTIDCEAVAPPNYKTSPMTKPPAVVPTDLNGNTQLTITNTDQEAYTIRTVAIYNAVGQLAAKADNESKAAVIRMGPPGNVLANGIYLVRIETDKGIFFNKINVNH